jgi:RNA polymerase sigma-70 factor (ECF subfamily)
MDEGAFQEVLSQAKAGERRALTELYASYNRMLVRLLRAQVPGYGEDLAHETWLAVTPKLRDFRGDERAFRMMLLGEARQQAADFKRKAMENPARPMPPKAMSAFLRPSAVGDAPVVDAAVAELLDGLRPLHAEILLLRVVGGLSAEETGALLGKSAGVIRVTQHRVLKQLARRLGSERIAR